MLIHLCELLVIVILLVTLGFRRKGASSFQATPHDGPGPYRGDATRLRLVSAQTRIHELERALDKAEREARWRNRIIYMLWRRNTLRMLGHVYWRMQTGFAKALLRIPWPSPHVRTFITAMAIAGALMGGVVGMIPAHANDPAIRPLHPRPIREPTMIPFQVTWGGEVTIESDGMLWQCQSDSRLRLVAVYDGAFTTCQVLPDLACPHDIRAFFLRDEREWLVWISLTNREPAPFIITLD
ncbi:hypothetical protein IT087_02270 [Candidatus Uhrbacteria bacterium]|nr:hypothetical protein [Candidatus Uhrbacteria bacterium]